MSYCAVCIKNGTGYKDREGLTCPYVTYTIVGGLALCQEHVKYANDSDLYLAKVAARAFTAYRKAERER